MTTEFTEKFSHAKKLSTLDIMVNRQVKELDAVYDPALTTYKVASMSYKRLRSNRAKRIAAMFEAAAERETQLRNPMPQEKIKADIDFVKAMSEMIFGAETRV